jgi:hypothetical protein
LQGLPKFTQSGIFGLKIYHLATLVENKKKTGHLLRPCSALRGEFCRICETGPIWNDLNSSQFFCRRGKRQDYNSPTILFPTIAKKSVCKGQGDQMSL